MSPFKSDPSSRPADVFTVAPRCPLTPKSYLYGTHELARACASLDLHAGMHAALCALRERGGHEFSP
eukprot:IDg15203t1